MFEQALYDLHDEIMEHFDALAFWLETRDASTLLFLGVAIAVIVNRWTAASHEQKD